MWVEKRGVDRQCYEEMRVAMLAIPSARGSPTATEDEDAEATPEDAAPAAAAPAGAAPADAASDDSLDSGWL